MINTFSKEVTLRDGRKILLRYPLPNDAEKLMCFINPIVREPARILLNVEQTLAEEQKYLKECLELIEKGRLTKIIASAEHEIVGVVDVTRQRYKMQHIGLFGITVSKTYRGTGLGKMLMEEVLNQAKEIMKLRMVILSANSNNVVALSLYKQMGFVQYGELFAAILHDGVYEDEVFMYKNL